MAKKSTKPHKSGKKKKGGLTGAAKLKAATKGAAGQMAKPAGVLAGLVLASVASNLLDKVPFLQAPADDGTGKFNIKKIAKPAILVVIGTATAVLTNKKTGVVMQFANGVGYGIAGGGVLSGVKAVTGKSLVSGLGDAGNGKAVLEANYYKEQANDMAKMLEEKKFIPRLPSGTDGLGKEWGSTMDAEKSDLIL